MVSHRRDCTELEFRIRAGEDRLGRQLDVLCAENLADFGEVESVRGGQDGANKPVWGRQHHRLRDLMCTNAEDAGFGRCSRGPRMLDELVRDSPSVADR